MPSVQVSPSRFKADRMVHWVDQVLSPMYQKFCQGSTWRPAINLYEDEGCYYIVADLAGMDAEQMDLRVEQGVLVLSGRRATPQPPDPAGPVVLHLMEIDHDQFGRTLQLPGSADPAGIEASYRNGYLWVRIPKKT